METLDMIANPQMLHWWPEGYRFAAIHEAHLAICLMSIDAAFGVVRS